MPLIAFAWLLMACGGAGTSHTEMVCHSIHENPVLFDKVLIGGQPASKFPERTLTPVKLVTHKLGQPDQIIYLKNPLFAWWRYDNTAYLVASLSANAPGYEYLAAKACNWQRTKKLARAFLSHH